MDVKKLGEHADYIMAQINKDRATPPLPYCFANKDTGEYESYRDRPGSVKNSIKAAIAEVKEKSNGC
jgi:hypothetical protein